jgi:hypothetical protein
VRRPGYMTMTVVVALLASQSFGFIAESFEDEKAIASERAREADAALRAELLERGFTQLASTRLAEKARGLEESRGVELMVATRAFRFSLADGPLAGESPALEVVERAASVVVEELSRYPRAFLEHSRLRRVIFCRGLREKDAEIPSLPNFHGALVIDAEGPHGFLRRLVHHELFHFADYADDDQLKRDPAWEGLNDRWFVYGSGGRFQRVPGSARLTANLPGFVSGYATSALEEDKAELFAFMVTEPAVVAAIERKDPVIAAKAARLKQQLARFSPALELGFWRSIGR